MSSELELTQRTVSENGKVSVPATQAAVRQVWAEVLQRSQITDSENFFDLGGDSLKALEVISRLQNLLNVELPLIAFFENPTIAHLTTVLNELRPEPAKVPTTALGTGPGGPFFDLPATLREVWQEVLQRENISPSDNFFDLGGDSLKALEVISRLQARLNVELPLIAFFEDPTILHLAAVVEKLAGATSEAPRSSSSSPRCAPLSFAQLQYWVLHQGDSLGYSQNEIRVVRITGEFHADILTRALDSILQRHQILATRLEPGEEEPLQVIDSSPHLHVECQDLSHVPAETRESAALEIAKEEGHRRFNLFSDLPIRARLLRLSNNDHLLIVTVHHVATDGYSSSILFKELAALYEAFLKGNGDPLASPETQYWQYADSERSEMRDGHLEKQLEFWRSYLEGAPGLWLPLDHPRPVRAGYAGQTAQVILPPFLLDGLKQVAKSNGTTLFTVLLSGLRLLLYRWTGKQDFVIGTVANNRSRAGSERLLGCFLNFLPLRNHVVGSERALDLLSRERQRVMDAFAHQDCPFLKIASSLSRTGEANPLYNVALLLQNFPEMEFAGSSFHSKFMELPKETAHLDLRWVASECPDGLRIECEFRTELFNRTTIDDLLSGFSNVLQNLAQDLASPVADFPIPSALAQQSETARWREQVSLAITSTFTGEPIRPPLEFWMKELGLQTTIQFAPFNQVFQQLLDPNSIVSRNQNGFNILLVRLTDWLRFEDNSTDLLGIETISATVSELVKTLESHRFRAPMFFCICPPEPKYHTPEWVDFLERAQRQTVERLRSIPGIDPITAADIFDLYPVANYADEYADKLGRVPYTPDFFTALASFLARRILKARTAAKKMIVLDAEGTLWEAQPSLHSGNDISRRILQEFVLQRLENGTLIGLCSSKTEEEIERLFQLRADMPLRPEHIIARSSGTQSASRGLQELSETLQIDRGTFVLISTDPERCREVEEQYPEVLALCLPSDESKIPLFLRNLWALDERDESDPNQLLTTNNRFLSRIATELTDVPSIRRAMDETEVRVRPQPAALVTPRTATEEVIAGIWAQVLKLDRVGVHDNFFALGGHSLLATQVMSRVRRSLGVELPLRSIFEAPTIAQFAERVEPTLNSRNRRALPPITKCAKRDRLPLSFAQQRLWFLDQMEEGGSPFYNMPRVVRMRGQLDVGALHRALNKIVERHESLRTTFAIEGSAPYQVIASQLELPLPVIDLTGLPEAQREQRALELAAEEAQRAFNLSKGPVMRAQVLRLEPQDHILFWTMHHIVSDRWSMGVVAEELAAHYTAFVKGGISPLPELTIQYADFAVWQRQWLQGEVLQNQLDYWKKQLSGAPSLLTLPTDQARPPQLSVRGGTQSVLLSREFIEELTSFSQREGATLFMTLLSVFQILLWRYSGQEDVVVGSPIANRTVAEIEPLIGFFVNTLALRGDLSGDPTFRELLARTKEVCLQGYANQDIPFERLAEELQPERSLSHTPIFQVMFALQNAPMQQMQLPGLTMERMPTTTGTSMFDMSWFVNEVADGFLLYVEYAADLFERATIRRALAHFQMLLRSATTNPERRISELELLGEEERQKVLTDFNATAADFPRLCIHQLMEASVARSPDAIAMICGDERTTYRELNQRANQIAHHLIRLGAGPDVLVGVFMERTPDLLPAILGVLKSGSAYVPLDPGYPRERLEAILADSNAPMVLTEKSLCGQLKSQSAEFVWVDSAEISRESRDNPLTAVTPDNLAYVLFTSGSTGRPKGVALEHHNNVTFVQWAQTVLTREELAGVLFCTSISFDMSTFEMFITLAAGGKVILAENPLYLSALPAKDEVTLINTVPSAVAELVRMNALPESLTTVALAGEALPDSLVEEIYRTGTVKKVYNLYGPTESGYSTWTLVPRGAHVTIGKPIANEQGYILDRNFHPLPIGVPGELYLAGEGLARGYFGRPDLTAERFVRNPFSIQKNARMYKTGDLCRWLPDGNIEYLGRIDHQVKLRGFRIELGEIESALTKHSGVRQCLVMAREDEPGIKRLVAYFVPQENADLSSDQLADHLKQSLPEYMVPSAFVGLSAFPLTSNGKIDRKALPAPEYQQKSSERYVAPRTPMEEKVAAIWAEVLRLERVGATDDFFAIGGHSLLAAQVISRLRQTLEIEIPLKAMFESPVLEVLAARIQTAKRGFEVPPILRISRERPIPASFAQQRMWFLEQLEPGKATFNIAYTMQIQGKVNVDAIADSLNLVAERQDSLRTSFAMADDTPIQVIHESVRVPLRRVDLTTLDRNLRQSEARRLIAEDANQPFDLSQAPLARALYLKLADEDHYLFINIHHIISDRWSTSVLIQELASAYEALVEGKTPDIRPLPLQYADYAVWQRAWLRGEALEKQLAYWKHELKDAPPVLELPTDRPRQAKERFRGDVAYLTLTSELRDQLHQLSRNHGATLFMTLLAGFQALLARHTGQDDIVVGTGIANRNHPDLENIVGCFLNTLALRTRLHDDPSFSEIIARARKAALGAYTHQDMPFEKLVEELNPERSLSHSPLVQVYFVLQNAPTETLEIKGLSWKHVPSGLQTVKGDMYLSMQEHPDGLQAYLEYSTDLFDRSTAERLLEHYRVLLQSVVACPERRVSDIPLLTDGERRQVLTEWNATESDYPRDRCLHQLIEEQAERTPHAIAVRMGEDKISYGLLNERANQLAWGLRKRGAGPGERVGICVERSIPMMVGLLGIMKSGAAYVPIDPAYPAERIKLILEGGQPPVLITQESLAATLPRTDTQLFFIDSDWPEIAKESTAAPANHATPEDPVYVIFTSGSTGKPKGVEVRHRSVVNLVTFMAAELDLGPRDVFPALASFAFDMSIPELYLALITGGQVVVADRYMAGDGEALSELLVRTGATIIHATPTTWSLLLEAGFTGKGYKRAIGAEAVPQNLCDRLLQADPSLYNFYGPTETTVWSTFHRFCAPGEPVTVGRPLANTQVYILDKRLQPVPVGVTGEIYIAGDGVACGYLNRPDLTQEKFLPDPFSGRAGAVMYKTGDLGRFLRDGRIDFLGRADSQVKLRGYRIELGEIESVLNQHGSIRECVVSVREDVPGSQRLVAYVIPVSDHAVNLAELRAWLKQRLPEYMVPAALVPLDCFPLTPNGKVDRKRLPLPDQPAADTETSTAPSTPTEEMLLGIWREVLHQDRIGTADNFFELGGHSLLAAQMIARIRQTFTVELPLRALFEAPTIAGLAEKVTRLKSSSHVLEAPPLKPVPRHQPLPLSFAQQRLWFLDQLEPGNPLYNVAFVTRIQGKLDVACLEKSLNEVIARHESLRTTFPSVDDRPVQAIRPSYHLKIRVADVSEKPSLHTREAEARRLATEEMQRSFDLALGPLVRALVIKIGEEDHALVLNTHHIISDRWSLAVLLQEVKSSYEASLADRRPALPKLEIQYADFAVWQREFLSGEVLNHQLAYWRQQLDGAPAVLELPTDRPRSATEQFWGAMHRQPMPAELVSDLRTLSLAERGTFFTTLLAGFDLLLSWQTGQRDLVVGTDFANRRQLETEKLIGFFVNLLPMRARIDPSATLTEFLHQVREVALGALAHQDVPFDKLVEELRPERSLTHNPLVQVLFVFQNTPRMLTEIAGLKLGPLGVGGSSRFDLVLFMNDPETEPCAMWMYNPKLFEASTVARMANRYELVLKTLCANPAAQLETCFDALDQGEKQQRSGEQQKFEQVGLDKLKKAKRKLIAEV